MGKTYRQKDDVNAPTFNTINGQLVIHIDDLLAGNARELIALRAVKMAEDMMGAWEASKDKIEPVEGA